MSLPINTTTDAYDAQRRALQGTGDLGQSLERLSSSSGDGDLTLSATLRDQVDTADQAQANAQSAVSLVQTAEGALHQVQVVLHRLRALAVANDGSLSAQDQAEVRAQANGLASELEQIGSQSVSGGLAPLGQPTTVSFELGPDKAVGVATISLGQLVPPSTFELGAGSVSQVDAALAAVSSASSRFAAIENSLQQAIAGTSVAAENAGAATSTVENVDQAARLAKLVAGQLVDQPDAAASAQANLSPATVRYLLSD